jgi:hypothetical protein
MNEQYFNLSTNTIKQKFKTIIHNLNVKLNYKSHNKLSTYQDVMCFNKIQLLRYTYKNNVLVIDSISLEFSKKQQNERLNILNDFYIKYPKDFIDKNTPKPDLLKRIDFNVFYKKWFEKQIDILVRNQGYKKEKYNYKKDQYYLFKEYPSAMNIKEKPMSQLDYLQYEDIHFELNLNNNCYQCAQIDYRDSGDSYDDYDKLPNQNELSAKFCGGQKIEFR